MTRIARILCESEHWVKHRKDRRNSLRLGTNLMVSNAEGLIVSNAEGALRGSCQPKNLLTMETITPAPARCTGPGNFRSGAVLRPLEVTRYTPQHIAPM